MGIVDNASSIGVSAISTFLNSLRSIPGSMVTSTNSFYAAARQDCDSLGANSGSLLETCQNIADSIMKLAEEIEAMEQPIKAKQDALEAFLGIR